MLGKEIALFCTDRHGKKPIIMIIHENLLCFGGVLVEALDTNTFQPAPG